MRFHNVLSILFVLFNPLSSPLPLLLLSPPHLNLQFLLVSPILSITCALLSLLANIFLLKLQDHGFLSRFHYGIFLNKTCFIDSLLCFSPGLFPPLMCLSPFSSFCPPSHTHGLLQVHFLWKGLLITVSAISLPLSFARSSRTLATLEVCF